MALNNNKLDGFSKWPKERKLEWVSKHYTDDPENAQAILKQFQYNKDLQHLLDSFSENTLSNFPMPYGIAPHFRINGRDYCVPMVIEESSVVAAASSAAKFWKELGGIRTKVLDTTKVGQIYFNWKGDENWLRQQLPDFIERVHEETADFTRNMRKRGGGILGVELEKLTGVDDMTYQLRMTFETCDSMGANFINSVLEETAALFEDFIKEKKEDGKDFELIMAILSNYTPECLVRAEVSCTIEQLSECAGELDAEKFANRFKKAVSIAKEDVYRATTHNKGIYNGVDAVILATGNDFRAVEAAGHAFAARDGSYRSLSECRIENGHFYFSLELPMAVGTVGGLTKLHPMAALSHAILGCPSARQLMQIIGAVGLAQNFSALRSLVTEGIQKGHMKMHLNNILNHFGSSEEERRKANLYFNDKIVSFRAVRSYLQSLRMASGPSV